PGLRTGFERHPLLHPEWRRPGLADTCRGGCAWTSSAPVRRLTLRHPGVTVVPTSWTPEESPVESGCISRRRTRARCPKSGLKHTGFALLGTISNQECRD